MKKDCSECEYFDEFHTSRVCHDCKPWGESAEAVQIHNDGTLEVKVPNAHKVGRVLVMDTDEELEKKSAKDEWIPCNERLPEKGEVVLITNGKGNVRCGQYRSEHDVRGGTHYWWWKGKTVETVLAWMPLPKPYKGGDDE